MLSCYMAALHVLGQLFVTHTRWSVSHVSQPRRRDRIVLNLKRDDMASRGGPPPWSRTSSGARGTTTAAPVQIDYNVRLLPVVL